MAAPCIQKWERFRVKSTVGAAAADGAYQALVQAQSQVQNRNQSQDTVSLSTVMSVSCSPTTSTTVVLCGSPITRTPRSTATLATLRLIIPTATRSSSG